MKKIDKGVSVLLHPVVLPFVGTWLYLNALPLPLSYLQKFLIFFIVLGATFLVPLLTLFLLKFLGYIKSSEVKTISERKFPVLIMIINYVFLAQVLHHIWQLRELTILSYATVASLIVTWFLFYAKIKVSLHMLGISGLLGFTLVFGSVYGYPIFAIALLVLLLGLLATVRLNLKAHNLKEILIGIFLGLGFPILLSFVL